MDDRHAPPPPPPGTEGEGGGEGSRGLPRFVRFDGILEGPVGDAQSLRAAAARLQRIDVVGMELEVDGGRFSLLPDDRPVPGEKFGPARREDLVGALQEVVSAARDPSAVESTLRCVAVYETDAVETLFAPVRGRLRPVGRVRGLRPEDQQLASPAAPSALSAYSRRQALGLGGLLLLGFALVCWRYGYLDRLFSADAGGLEARTGAFEDLLEMEVEHRWGNYVVRLRRGASYPRDAEAAARLEEQAVSTDERAAVRAVNDGGDVYLRLEDRDGEVLARQRVALRALLSDEEGEVEESLPGKIAAHRLVLSLDAGEEP